MRQRHITLRIWHTSIRLGASWLVMLPLVVWLIATLYVPIIAPSLNVVEAWGIALATALALFGSLAVHTLAHARAARVTGHRDGERGGLASIPLYAFGDAAQVWPAAATPGREALVAMAGPVVSSLLGGIAYLLWDRQAHPYLDVGALLLAAANAALAVVNLAPWFPLDGGRLTRAIWWGLLERPDQATRAGAWLGRLMAAALAGWGIILLAQRARFSLETGAGTLLVAGVFGLALWEWPAWEWNRPTPARGAVSYGSAIRGFIAGMLILALLAIAWSLVPTNNGLEAPGIALAVEPMIEVPPEYRHPHTGSFILTTVFPQTPITVGQWVYGELSPVVKIVPPERIVPPDTTPQELAQRGRKMLEESETLAKVVALRLAGFDVTVTGEAVEVLSIVPESPASEVLQPGDLITHFNDEPIRNTEQLIERVRAQDPDATIDLTIEREGKQMQVLVPLLPPSAPGEPPRIGITIQTVGTGVELPFPIDVQPQKIAGGPSAGLMFSLTIYNLITPEDLTGGRKIAGTGTINLEGEVGPIGGVEQKVVAAERAGAEYFLVPPVHYEDARRVARRIKVVQVATAEEAIEVLQSLLPPRLD